MTTIGRVTLALGVLAPLIVGCARHVAAPHPTAVTASRPATSPTPPVWPDAAPAPEAPIPDAAGPTPESGPTAGFSAREELPDVHFATGQVQADASARKALDAPPPWANARPEHPIHLD